MKIYTLLENTSCSPELTPEHGLSLYIETEALKILFDMGKTNAFARNAELMGIDLTKVDIAFLSHGHDDHSGGMAEFLRINSRAKVYVSPYAFGDYCVGDGKFIGLDKALKDSGRLVFSAEGEHPAPGLTVLSCNGMTPVEPIMPGSLTKRVNGELVPDDFLHEQYLIIEERGKKVVISGCSHKGIVNVTSWTEPDVLIGGFHFMTLDTEGVGAETIKNAAHTLLAHPAQYYTGHCTGAAQFDLLKEYMGEKLGAITTGGVIEL